MLKFNICGFCNCDEKERCFMEDVKKWLSYKIPAWWVLVAAGLYIWLV